MPEEPYILEQNFARVLLAISPTEIGKVVLPSPFVTTSMTTGKVIENPWNKPTIENEIELLKYANKINGLMPKFIRQDTWKAADGTEHQMLVMERLYPLPLNHFDLPTREKMIGSFEMQVKNLHDANFVHGDLIRPANFINPGDVDWMLGNIMQTESGIRLLDSGFSKRYTSEDSELFCYILMREQREVKALKALYLGLSTEAEQSTSTDDLSDSKTFP
jgi:tRNA A-37 threonylcarbamoyl transferase component Bud32